MLSQNPRRSSSGSHRAVSDSKTRDDAADLAEADAFLREVEAQEEAAEADRFLHQMETEQRFFEVPPPSSRPPRTLDPERLEAERRALDPETQARQRRLRRVVGAVVAVAFVLAAGGAVVVLGGG